MAKKSAKPNSAAGKRKGSGSKTGAANRGKKAGQGAVRAGAVGASQALGEPPVATEIYPEIGWAIPKHITTSPKTAILTDTAGALAFGGGFLQVLP